jgi:hypothetical protein
MSVSSRHPAQQADTDSPFYVPAVLDFLGALVHRHRDFWIGLGRLESSLLAEQLRAVRVTMPIYVCGLARSGTTLLHEVIAAHPRMASHRIKDYPLLFTPYWWRQASARLRPAPPHERPHRDRMMITTESPDAVEEMLWMAFFPNCHDPAVDNRLGWEDRNPAFEKFYRTHLQKLLLAETAERYVAKANYHVARLPYLLRLFPDARFVIPVREPAAHIASLVRQHRWFSAGQRGNRRALEYFRRSGHFEFGLDRRPMNLGDSPRVERILHAWADGQEIRGWALLWAMVHEYLARLLESDARVKAAALPVRFEELCAAPAATLRAVFGHCRLDGAEAIVERFAPGIRTPDYYQSPFSPEELALVRTETADAARSWGY